MTELLRHSPTRFDGANRAAPDSGQRLLKSTEPETWSGNTTVYRFSSLLVVILLLLSAFQPLRLAAVRMRYRHPIEFSYNEG